MLRWLSYTWRWLSYTWRWICPRRRANTRSSATDGGGPMARCHHWALQTSRAVLAALGEPEPQLPPFDPTRIKTIEYEADIRRLIEEHAAKQF